MCVCACACMCVCACVCARACVCAYVCQCMCMRMCPVRVCVCVGVRMRVCMRGHSVCCTCFVVQMATIVPMMSQASPVPCMVALPTSNMAVAWSLSPDDSRHLLGVRSYHHCLKIRLDIKPLALRAKHLLLSSTSRALVFWHRGLAVLGNLKT